MLRNTKTMVEGAISVAIFAVILIITFYVPILGIISLWFLPLPMTYFSARNGFKPSIACFFAMLLISLLFAGPLSVLLTFLFVIIGLVTGILYRRKHSAFIVWLGGSLAAVSVLILLFIASILLFKINPTDILIQSFNGYIDLAEKMSKSVGQDSKDKFEALRDQLKFVPYIIPTTLVLSGVFYALIVQLISMPILKRLRLDVPKWTPFREWCFPKSLLWYYLISLVGMMFIDLKPGTMLYSLFYNVFYALEIVMVIQGCSFIFFFFYQKKVNKSIPIIIVIFSLLLSQLLLNLVRLLGIIDLGFELRKRFKK